MKHYSRNCTHCSEPFMGTYRRIYCSKKCKYEAGRDARRKPCEHCGGPKAPGPARICPACKAKLPEVQRQRQKARAAGRPSRSESARNYADQKRGAKKINDKGQYWCLDCQAYLSPKKFTILKSGKIPPRCRKCDSARQHALRIQKVYGITIEAYNLLLEWQGGVCYICRKPSRVRRLAVDHDHKTGKVRGLLCRRCNREILGYFANDQIDVFQRAIDYLTEPPLEQVVRGVPPVDLGGA